MDDIERITIHLSSRMTDEVVNHQLDLMTEHGWVKEGDELKTKALEKGTKRPVTLTHITYTRVKKQKKK